MHDLVAAVPVREVERHDVDSGECVRAARRAPLHSCGSRRRRATCSRRARPCRRPPPRPGAAISPTTGTPACSSAPTSAAGSPRRTSLPGLSSTAPSRPDEDRVVDVDRVGVPRIVARDDDRRPGVLEDAAENLVLQRRGGVIRRGTPAELAPVLDVLGERRPDEDTLERPGHRRSAEAGHEVTLHRVTRTPHRERGSPPMPGRGARRAWAEKEAT